jgi:uncharacterized small protein (DUF1192 family)
MSDLPVAQHWLVSPSFEVEKKWLQVQINERVSRVNKIKQDIQDLKDVQLIKLEAQVILLEQEINKLKAELNKKEPLEVQGDSNG